MNQYSFDELKVGMEQSFLKKITQEDMDRFFLTTQDSNDLHVKDEQAKEFGFKSKVVYGMLVSSLISTLCGVHLPGKYCLILSVESMMKNPCYVDDTLNIHGKILRKIDSVKTVIIETDIKNQEEKIIQKGKVFVKLLK